MTLETLISIEEIRQLMARYARYADARQWDSLAGLFTPDGTFTSHAVDGGIVADMKGRQAIEETLAAVNAGDVVPIHMLLTSEIEPAGPDTAHGTYAMADLIYRGEGYTGGDGADLPDFRVMRGWGHYDADFVKTDGEWRIRTLVQTRTRLEFER
jgi:SnoaL-like domain